MRPLLKSFVYAIFATIPAFSQTPLTITTTFLPSGTIQVSYTANVQSSGGVAGPQTWSIISGSLPPGLSISGTPTSSGNYNFPVQVTDQRTNTATRQLSIFINPPPLTITTTSPLPDAIV